MKSNMVGHEKFVFWNDDIVPAEAVSISPVSEGFLYGSGCFETMTWMGGKVRFLRDHWRRLEGGAAGIGIHLGLNTERMVEILSRLSEYNQCEEGVARISLHQRGKGSDVLVRLFPRAVVEGSHRVTISRIVHPGFSAISGWKNNNYLLFWLAYREAMEAGFNEAVLCRGDEVVEGSRANLWVLRDGVLRTPPLSSGALPGVVRKRILENSGSLPVAVREERLGLADLERCNGLFFSNAGMLFRAATQLNERDLQPQNDLVADVCRVLEMSDSA